MLEDTTLGVLGAGNMGEALIRGVLGASVLPAERVVASDADEGRRRSLEEALGIRTTADNRALAADVDVLMVAVKPDGVGAVLDEVADLLTEEHTVVSIAAGLSLSSLEAHVPEGVPVVRVMPNTPSLVGEGVSAYCLGRFAGERHGRVAEALLGAVGVALEVTEPQIDAITALSGSGPAYTFYLMEAMREGAEALGLPADVASGLAVQTVLGAARLAKETGEDPAVLRRRVMSPGGTTEAAIRRFEARGLKGIVLEGMRAARDRSIEMGRPPRDAPPTPGEEDSSGG
ncbi:MAG: pyrroline-5-carboxylate reductase [Myxococcota bacterium]